MVKTILINSTGLGHGDEKLGEKLMGSFLRKLWANSDKPEKIVFYNSGVKLLAKGSNVLDALDSLLKAGVDLIACGTCMGYYGLNDDIVLGRISNMQEIVEILISSEGTLTV
ncbi:MAG: sulfurtransferase-like selenium metabolism protein YedF [Elusimicrobiota bacterium]